LILTPQAKHIEFNSFNQNKCDGKILKLRTLYMNLCWASILNPSQHYWLKALH